MGGSGSIHPWFDEGLANTDLMHFTPKGYAFQAKLLVEALNQLGAR
jgi:lysophospholipase L1-like esterase